MRTLRLVALISLLSSFPGCLPGSAESTDGETTRIAAEQGDIQAQYRLGVLLALEMLPESEPTEALDWYRRVAEQGDLDCKFNLGQLYWTGTEPRSVSQRVRDSWAERLSRLGEPTSPLRVGSDFPMGAAGLAADAQEAFVWFSAAADGGHVMAWRRLAEMRLNGKGAERSLAHAHMWFSLLAERGLGNSGVWLTTVRGEMSEAEVAESKRLLETFRSRSTTGR